MCGSLRIIVVKEKNYKFWGYCGGGNAGEPRKAEYVEE